jgi:hypothetical protein
LASDLDLQQAMTKISDHDVAESGLTSNRANMLRVATGRLGDFDERGDGLSLLRIEMMHTLNAGFAYAGYESPVVTCTTRLWVANVIRLLPRRVQQSINNRLFAFPHLKEHQQHPIQRDRQSRKQTDKMRIEELILEGQLAFRYYLSA